MKLSIRTWVSAITLGLVVLLLILSRNELLQAWELMGTVDLRIMLLFVPLFLISNYAAAEMIFSYLSQKGLMKNIKRFRRLRISLEMNFANHALPSGGASGMSYMVWRLSRLGIPASTTTIAVGVRLVAGFAAFLALLVLAVLLITIDGGINRWMILISCALAIVMIFATGFFIYSLRNKDRIKVFAHWLAKFSNGVVYYATLKKKRDVVRRERIEQFMLGVQDDYRDLENNPSEMLRPFIWGLVFTCAEVAMFWTVFWALGQPINPAPILIAYGLAMLAGFLILTPGGSGAYEALMVAVLSAAGIAQGMAIAGIVLTRVIMLLAILLVGYMLYQLAIIKYGKSDNEAADIER